MPPRFKLPVERHTLANGLRVVVAPDKSAPTIATAVYYDVGFRSEPEGRTGFAHLFEHLCFQGTVSLDKGEADKLIEGNGGFGNGSTNSDWTNYIAQMPSNALELALFLEADRMRGLRITEENLQNQIDVVKEEIRVNVLNQPYGGFPWIDMPPVMFQTFNNAHNGYGSFVDLEAATVGDAQDFYDRYYAPANAVLAVVGDLDPARTFDLVERHFGDIPARRAAKPGDYDEPEPDGERRVSVEDPLAPLPAVAVAFRVPDPIGATEEYAAAAVLQSVLGDGEASRLHQRLVKQDRIATYAFGMVGTFGNPWEVRHPTTLQLLAYFPTEVTVDRVLAAVDEEIDKVATDVSQDELARVVTALTSDHYRRMDHLLNRAELVGVLEQQRGQAELAAELPALLAAVTPEAVMAAAERWLVPRRRAVLDVVPGGGQ